MEHHAAVERGVRTGVVRDADRPGRALRVSAHPAAGAGAGRVVLSTWQGGTCVSTVRLDRAEVVDLLAALGAALLADPAGPAGREGPAAP
ncbi:hypothetical protein [Kineococcus radiotolerans]|uniref:hypothetical protein n=1 Tax=Kineococcus radiotolerans TaxID=131568 RepID=UPI0012FF0A95|nr:hypothetical protein [Kineococcus radiotolerans]